MNTAEQWTRAVTAWSEWRAAHPDKAVAVQLFAAAILLTLVAFTLGALIT